MFTLCKCQHRRPRIWLSNAHIHMDKSTKYFSSIDFPSSVLRNALWYILKCNIVDWMLGFRFTAVTHLRRRTNVFIQQQFSSINYFISLFLSLAIAVTSALKARIQKYFPTVLKNVRCFKLCKIEARMKITNVPNQRHIAHFHHRSRNSFPLRFYRKTSAFDVNIMSFWPSKRRWRIAANAICHTN